MAMASGPEGELRAFGEAIERFAMLHAPPDVRATRASDLRDPHWSADDIAQLTFPAAAYEQERFRFPPFGDSLPLDWSWAECLLDGRRSLVPTSLIGRASTGSPRLVDATSNGYAAHPNRERAIAHALLELIERDALLLAWWSNRSLVRLRDAETSHASEAYLVPSDVGLPVVLLVGRSARGGLRTASAAATNLADALSAANREMAVALAPLDPGPIRGLEDPSGRLGPADHVRHYEQEGASMPVREWLAGSSADSVSEAGGAWPLTDGRSATSIILAAIEGAGLVPWIVDRSLPRTLPGWSVVRAIVPGITEISWGTCFRREAGARARRILADASARNLAPHPFG